MEEENNNNFEVISSKTSNANFKQNKQTKQNSFGKTVLIPFAKLVIVSAFFTQRILLLISFFSKNCLYKSTSNSSIVETQKLNVSLSNPNSDKNSLSL